MMTDLSSEGLKRALELVRNGIVARKHVHAEEPVLDGKGLTSYAQHLVLKFERQIGAGCLNPTCGQTLCWTHRKSAADRPLRPFTSVTTRALAYRLASRPDAEDFLCDSRANQSTTKSSTVNKIDSSSLVQNLFKPDAPLGLRNTPLASILGDSRAYDFSTLSTTSYESTLALACINTSLNSTDQAFDDWYIYCYPFLNDIEHFNHCCCTTIFANPRNLITSFQEPQDDGKASLLKFAPFGYERICSDPEWAVFARPSIAADEYSEHAQHPTCLYLVQYKIDSALRWWISKCGDVVINSLRTAVQDLALNLSEYSFEEKRWVIVLAIHALVAFSPVVSQREILEAGMGVKFPQKTNDAFQNKAALQLSQELGSLLAQIVALPTQDYSACDCTNESNTLFESIMSYFSGSKGEEIKFNDSKIGLDNPNLLWRPGFGPSVALGQQISAKRIPGFRSLFWPLRTPETPQMAGSLLGVPVGAEFADIHATVRPASADGLFMAWLIRGFWESWDRSASVEVPSAAADILYILDLIKQEDNIQALEYPRLLTYTWPDPFELAESFIEPLPNRWSLLYYPWCFGPSDQIHNFRALCLTRMIRAWFDSKLHDDILFHVFRWSPNITGYKSMRGSVLRSAVCPQLTMSVDRDNLVQSAFDQLWHRDSKELLRSLKVKINHAGEEGQDQGGVAQEFFLLVFAEILSPDYGVFTIDEKTRMAWFDVKCLEPLYKIEMIGILMGLAVHNGFTLPLTLPDVFYKKLCQREKPHRSTQQMLDELSDGFPEQVRNLSAILYYTEEEIDALALDYVFAFDFYDKRGVIDMLKTKRPEEDDEDEENYDDDETHEDVEEKQESDENTELTGGQNNEVHQNLRDDNENIDAPPRDTEHTSSDIDILPQADVNDNTSKSSSPSIKTTSPSSPSAASSTHEPSSSSPPPPPPMSPESQTQPQDLNPNASPNPNPSVKPKSKSRPRPDRREPWSLISSITNASAILATATPITLANRTAFVHDYTTWLTTSSVHRLFTALSAGFHRILPPDVLCTIDPANLKRLVEGETVISAASLKQVTRYEGFAFDTSLITWFWEVVEAYDNARRALLLEFVTASHRIPATGYESIQFVVQRAGPDSERLPSSSTCFGHLLLPEYDSKEKLEVKMAVALENVIGFGRM